MKNLNPCALFFGLCVTAGLCQQPSAPAASAREILRTSSDPEALERAATALARSPDSRDLELLGGLLRDPGFLHRLDKPGDTNTYHLGRVMTAMRDHATERTAGLCLSLADDAVFSADEIRLGLLLNVLASVRPMSDRTAALFQRTNAEGYFGSNARLLAVNGSERALSLFESMMLDKDVPVERRIDCLHLALVPRRTELPILRAARRILSRTTEQPLAVGVIESLFDYQPRWFGVALNSPRPAAWETAPPECQRIAVQLTGTVLARTDLDPRLRNAVMRTRDELRNKVR